MSCRKCHHNQNFRTIPRERYNPTYVHHQIFGYDQLKPQSIKCTPTYHSTALDTDGYNIKTVHQKKPRQQIRPNTAAESVYINNSNQKRVLDLNPHNCAFTASRDHWFDHTRQHLINQIKDCKKHSYSKDRKYLDLTSDPVFTDYNYEANQNTVPLVQHCCRRNVAQQVLNQPQIQNASQLKQNIVHPVQIQLPPPKHILFSPSSLQLPREIPHVHNVQEIPKVIQKPRGQGPHANCIPQYEKKLINKATMTRPKTALKGKVANIKPTFTVIRKSKIHC